MTSSGAAVAGAKVKLRSSATGFPHGCHLLTRRFPLPALAGEYEVSAEASGFERGAVRQATVEAGVTTTTDFDLHIGDVKPGDHR